MVRKASGDTGTAGFTTSDSTMDDLRERAGGLQTRLSGIAGELSGLHLAPNALGPIGLATVPALNSANDNAVAQAERGARAFGEIQAGLRATQQTFVNTDTDNASSLKDIDPTTRTPFPAGVGDRTWRADTSALPAPVPVPEVAGPPPPVTPKQQTMLDLHGVRPVRVRGGDLVHAMANTVAPDSSGARQVFVNRMTDRTTTGASVSDLATAAGVRVHVLGEDGKFTSHGPVTGAPVHVVEVRGQYHATKESVHIGRPGVAYPGPSKVEMRGGAHTVHRGEFEVETVAGRHHVRVYTAVVNPATFDMTDPANPRSAFKDIQQDPTTGRLNISTGSNAQLWAGVGRPQRALQWLAKYEHTDGGRPIDPKRPGGAVKRPVLRSFLVPLDTFNRITSGATVEGAPGATSRSDTYNVDQRGEPNQFGIGGDHLRELVEHAEPGSLVSYPSNPSESFANSDQAGRITPASELYQRLGLGQDFRSDAVGKAYDPWFSWTRQPDGTWKFGGFRNDANRLHEIATELSEYHDAWQHDGSERLNRFLNDVGPPSSNVDKLTTEVLSTGPGALRQYLGTSGIPAADQAAFQRGLNNAVSDALPATTKDLDRLIKQMKGPVTSRAELETLISEGFKSKTGPRRLFAEHVIDKAAAQFAAGIERHPNLTLLTDDSRHVAADVMRDRMKQALTEEFANLDRLDSSAAGKGWLTGARLTEFTKGVADRLATQPPLDTPVAVDPAKLVDVAERKVFPDALKEAVSDFRGHDLVNTTPDDLKSLVTTDVLPKLPTDIATALRDHPAMSLVDKTFRDTMADTVALGAQSRASGALSHFTFDPTDPAEVDAFMAKVPAIATQAEIGSVISTDSDQIALDPRTRVQDGEPFLNTYHQWNLERGQQREVVDS
jgi:hypothetical protein